MDQEGNYFADRYKLGDKYVSCKDSIADELADIMIAVVLIAEHYYIDLVATNKKLARRKMNS